MTHVTLEEMPPVLTAQNIADYLGLARYTVYGLYDEPVECGGIPNFKIGNSRRTLKTDFVEFIEQRKREHQADMDQRMERINGSRKRAKIG